VALKPVTSLREEKVHILLVQRQSQMKIHTLKLKSQLLWSLLVSLSMEERFVVVVVRRRWSDVSVFRVR
jgi:hypothetical protein